MKKSKEKFLHEIATSSELKNNIVATLFALNPDINISQREHFYDNVAPYYKRYKETKTIIPIDSIDDKNEHDESWEGKDLRIKNIQLKSIRGFPDSKKPFGINFCDKDGNPQSMIILGSNGSGKSSIFTTLEYSYCKEIGEVFLRDYHTNSDNRFINYLSHNQNPYSQSYGVTHTVDKELDIQSENTIPENINPKSFFISDYEIYENGKLNYENGVDKSFHNLIANNLGLNNLLDFEKKLKLFTSYNRRTETNRIRDFNNIISTQSVFIESTNKAKEDKFKLISDLKNNQRLQPEENKLSEMITILNQLRTYKIPFDFDFESLHKLFIAFQNAFLDYERYKIKNGDFNELQFLNLGLALINEATDCPFCNHSTSPVEEIKKDVTTRIENIKLLNKLIQILDEKYNALFDSFANMVYQFNTARGKISQELKLIEDKAEFNTIQQLDATLFLDISKIWNNEFILQFNQIENNREYIKDKYKFLNNYFSGYYQIIENGVRFLNTKFTEFIIKRENLITSIDTRLSENRKGKTITEQIINLENEIKLFENQLIESNKIITANQIERNEIQSQVNLFYEIKENTISYLKVLHKKLNEEVLNVFLPIKELTEEVLNLYLKNEKREYSLIIEFVDGEVDEDTGEILSQVIEAKLFDKNNNSYIELSKYFNTFHYRLFCTIVGISVAFASRIASGVNMPLVLDDVFYASDYRHRTNISNFISSIFEIFKKYSLDLQFILFTHDELIFDSAYEAIISKDIPNVIFSKIFPYSQAKENNEFRELTLKFNMNIPKIPSLKS